MTTVFFDLDGTLMDHEAAEREAAAALFRAVPSRWSTPGVRLRLKTRRPRGVCDCGCTMEQEGSRSPQSDLPAQATNLIYSA